jgi:drug/metabolite transporter (DMT)-like permease
VRPSSTNTLLQGYLLGFIGVIIFALTLPLTRIAVQEMSPLFLSLGRTVAAAAVAGPLLLITRQPWPSRRDFVTLTIVAAGVVFGFPLLSASAMTMVPASHGGVVLGALPLATAIMSTMFAGERPSASFWIWAVAGSAAVVLFAAWDGGFSLQAGDVLLVLAAASAGMGYAAGGNLSRRLGGWQVICWALLIALPVTLPITLFAGTSLTGEESATTWACFAYLALMSQLAGFFAWNRGLALGGVAKVGQVQLLQTFLTIFASWAILGEQLSIGMFVCASFVGLCIWFSRKAQVTHKPQPAASSASASVLEMVR